MLLSLYLAVLDDQSNEEQFIDVYNTYKRLVYHTAYKIMGDGDIDEYRDLNGRYNTANGATDDFDIDSGLKKVNIGWTHASVSTVRGGTLALPASIDTIELN